MLHDAVNHPSHYTAHPKGIECIDVIEDMTLNIGTAIKYLWRQGLKLDNPAEQDLRKAIWYIEREIQRLPPKPSAQDAQRAASVEAIRESFRNAHINRSDETRPVSEYPTESEQQ